MKHYLGISLVIAVAAVAALLLIQKCQQPAYDMAGAVRDAFSSALRVQPQVRVNQTVIYGQVAPVAELAVVTQEEYVHLNQQEQTEIWGVGVPLSRVETKLGGTFRIKAGFDLNQDFVAEIDPASGDLRVSLPPAQILSVEPVGELTWEEQNNWLNWTTSEERQEALNSLLDSARRSSLQSGILEQAEAQAQERLREVLTPKVPGDLRLKVRRDPS